MATRKKNSSRAGQIATPNTTDKNEVAKPQPKPKPPTAAEMAKNISDLAIIPLHGTGKSKGAVVSYQAAIMTGATLKEFHRLQTVQFDARMRGLEKRTDKELVAAAIEKMHGGIKAAKRTLDQAIEAGYQITVLHNRHHEVNGKTGWADYLTTVLGISTSQANRLEKCARYGYKPPERDDQGDPWSIESFIRWSEKGTSLTPKQLAAHKAYVAEHGLPESTPISKVTTRKAKKGGQPSKGKKGKKDDDNMATIAERGQQIVNEYRTYFNGVALTADRDQAHVDSLRKLATEIARLMADHGISLVHQADQTDAEREASAPVEPPKPQPRTRRTKRGRKLPAASNA